MSFKSEFNKGIINENPAFRMLLGMCPTLAISLAISNGIGMGLAATFVLVGSNVIISALRKVTPGRIRIPIFIVVIATFVTTVDLIMAAFLPDLHEVLGIFIPLIVVNCIIFARAEAFASQRGIIDISSAEERAEGPIRRRRSLGLSLAGISLIVGDTSLIDFTGKRRHLLNISSYTLIPIFLRVSASFANGRPTTLK
jgi:hypothetical protein